jgi:hypothetical protein
LDPTTLDREAASAMHNTAELANVATAVSGVSVIGAGGGVIGAGGGVIGAGGGAIGPGGGTIDPGGAAIGAARLPHIVCIAIDGVLGEAVLLSLDRAGVAAHSGSACSSEVLEPSPVLEAMGADPDSSLRLSVGWSTTKDDVDAFGAAFGDAVAQLRALQMGSESPTR